MNNLINHFNCNLSRDSSVDDYIRDALSENTILAYQSDLKHYYAWGGVIPSSPDMVAQYLVSYADSLSMATLSRRMVAIAKAHTIQGHASPTNSDVVQLTLKGIKRKHGRPQRQVSALLKEDIISMLNIMPDTTKGIRDRALLLIGFCGAFRRSELVTLYKNDIEFVSQGIIITLQRSKTDQSGAGRKIAVPYGRGLVCPVKSLQAWLDVSKGDDDGAIFCPIDKGGNIGGTSLTSHAVAVIIKSYAAKIGLNPVKLSGHSLRSGLATSAAQSGVPSHKIRQQTWHRSDMMLARYIRDGGLFTDNAAGAIF
jgi:site-specific recombinase XerD